MKRQVWLGAGLVSSLVALGLFWSGASGETAALAAGAAGAGRTLAQSPIGSYVARLTSSIQNYGWRVLSRYWVSGAGGTVKVNANNPGPVLGGAELPRLMSNPNVFNPIKWR